MEEQIQNNQEPKNSNVMLSQTAIELLSKTAPWMKFLSILGFIGCGLMVVFAFLSLVFSSMMHGGYGAQSMTFIPFIIYIIGAVVMFFPLQYLYNYANGLRDFSVLTDNNLIEEAFLMQKKYWKYMGVVAIVYLSLVVIMIIVSVISILVLKNYY